MHGNRNNQVDLPVAQVTLIGLAAKLLQEPGGAQFPVKLELQNELPEQAVIACVKGKSVPWPGTDPAFPAQGWYLEIIGGELAA